MVYETAYDGVSPDVHHVLLGHAYKLAMRHILAQERSPQCAEYRGACQLQVLTLTTMACNCSISQEAFAA